MGFHNLYSLNCFRARFEGVDNKALVELCMANADDITKNRQIKFYVPSYKMFMLYNFIMMLYFTQMIH